MADARTSHCSNCRMSSGSIGTYNAMYPLDAFKVTSEQQPVKYYDSNSISGNTNIRCFCGKCGSAIITISEKKKLAIMKVPTLEEQSGFVPQVEIFTKTKKDWEPEHYSESAKQFSENAQ